MRAPPATARVASSGAGSICGPGRSAAFRRRRADPSPARPSRAASTSARPRRSCARSARSRPRSRSRPPRPARARRAAARRGAVAPPGTPRTAEAGRLMPCQPRTERVVAVDEQERRTLDVDRTLCGGELRGLEPVVASVARQPRELRSRERGEHDQRGESAQRSTPRERWVAPRSARVGARAPRSEGGQASTANGAVAACTQLFTN